MEIYSCIVNAKYKHKPSLFRRSYFSHGRPETTTIRCCIRWTVCSYVQRMNVHWNRIRNTDIKWIYEETNIMRNKKQNLETNTQACSCVEMFLSVWVCTVYAPYVAVCLLVRVCISVIISTSAWARLRSIDDNKHKSPWVSHTLTQPFTHTHSPFMHRSCSVIWSSFAMMKQPNCKCWKFTI